MCNYLVTLLIALIVVTPIPAEGQESTENLQSLLITRYLVQFAAIAERELAESGLSKPDILRTSEEFSKFAANCFIESIIDQSEAQSLDADQILESLEDQLASNVAVEEGSVFGGELDVESLEPRLEGCLTLAFQNAGVRYP